LELCIQHGWLPVPRANIWRDVFRPAGSGAHFHVRNAVHCRDIRIAAGETTILPTEPGRRTYFFVFEGCVMADGQSFGDAESRLATGAGRIPVQAIEDAVVLAFVVDTQAEVNRGGTGGDGEPVHAMAPRARR
jgi:redox-sensitive bicupin YhaK (pirin superfamily)